MTVSRSLQLKPRLLHLTSDLDSRNQPVRHVRFQIVQPRQTTFPVDDPQRTEDPFQTITRPLLEPIEMLIIHPIRHSTSLPDGSNRCDQILGRPQWRALDTSLTPSVPSLFQLTPIDTAKRREPTSKKSQFSGITTGAATGGNSRCTPTRRAFQPRLRQQQTAATALSSGVHDRRALTPRPARMASIDLPATSSHRGDPPEQATITSRHRHR